VPRVRAALPGLVRASMKIDLEHFDEAYVREPSRPLVHDAAMSSSWAP
jgi:hypothetical protein